MLNSLRTLPVIMTAIMLSGCVPHGTSCYDMPYLSGCLATSMPDTYNSGETIWQGDQPYYLYGGEQEVLIFNENLGGWGWYDQRRGWHHASDDISRHIIKEHEQGFGQRPGLLGHDVRRSMEPPQRIDRPELGRSFHMDNDVRRGVELPQRIDRPELGISSHNLPSHQIIRH
jgi:hypothetical protein